MAFEDNESHLKKVNRCIEYSSLRKLHTHSQLGKVDRVASIFSIGGSCIYNFITLASFGSSPVFSTHLASASLSNVPFD